MKKFTPILISSMMVLSFAAQAEGPIDGKVYGKINAAYLSTDDAGTTDTYLESHASRFGFKGKTDVDNGMSVVYQLEYEVNPTEKTAHKKNNDSTIFKTRNSFIGLGSAVGTFILGIHDTPFKMAQGKVDLFNDMTYGDIKNLVRGEVRADDVFAYLSPEMYGFSLKAAVTKYEDGQSKTDATSLSVTYKGIKNLYLAVAVDSEVAGYDATRFTAQYKLADLTLGALYNKSESTASGGKSSESTVISADYKIDKFKLKAQYGTGDEKMGKDGKQISFGADYKLGKKSKLYLYHSSLNNDADTIDKRVTGLGIEHKF